MKKYIVAIIMEFCCVSQGLLAMKDVEMGLQPVRQHSRSAPAESEVLDLHGQNIITMPDVCFRNIHTLNLSHNGILGFDLSKLLKVAPCLRTLDLSANKIQELNIKMLKGMPRDFSLDLSENPMQSVEHGVERVIGGLRDKDITIRCYHVLLKAAQLRLLQDSLNRQSSIHSAQQGAMIGVGALSIVGGIALLVSSDYHCQAQESDALLSESLSSDSLAPCKHLGLFTAGMGSIIFGAGLLFGYPIASIIQHDMHQSRLYW